MDASPTPTANCWYLTGATAVGKSTVALELAGRLGAEILSLDSMAVYRGLDIGTAKPSAAEQGRVPHHLIDLVEPDQDYTLAQYVDAAERATREIVGRGAVPLFVGGTPLYLKALLRGIFSGPPADWDLRRELQAFAKDEGPERLHARLAKVDSRTAARLHPRDERRVIRALEVWEKTGQSISDLQQQFDRARPAAACRVFVLSRPRDELVKRIDARVEAMFAEGLVDEVRTLLARPLAFSRTASQAVGYREVLELLADERDLPATVELVKLRTRQFAKRQMTWFRSLSECRTVSVGGDENPAEIASMVQTMAAREPRK